MAGNNGHGSAHQSGDNVPPPPGSLEEFWANMLSEDPPTVRQAWDALTAEEKAAVYRHLQRMASEAGWQPSQRDAARAALQAIGPFPPASED